MKNKTIWHSTYDTWIIQIKTFILVEGTPLSRTKFSTIQKPPSLRRRTPHHDLTRQRDVRLSLA